MTQIRQMLPSKFNVIDHLEMKENRKNLLELITLGTMSYDVDIKLFSHVAKYIENAH